MKIAKLVIGIISIILSLLVLFQSCVTGLSNSIQNNSEAGGSVAMLLAICFLVAGIVALTTRSSSGNGGFVAAGFYLAGGIITFLLAGGYIYLGSVIHYFWSHFCHWGHEKK